VVGPKGTRRIIVNSAPIDSRLTATVLTTPHREGRPLHFELREESNNQYDFAEFVLRAIEQGALEHGDILALDNASVHCGFEACPILVTILQALGIEVCIPPSNSSSLIFGTDSVLS
jgi:hypothetical protein